MQSLKKNSTAVFVLSYILFGILFALLLFFLSQVGLHFLPNHAQKQQAATSQQSPSPIVVLDAGHGGEDGGAIGINGVVEKDLNFSITKKIDQILQANGIQTVLTRTDDRLLYDPNSDYRGQKKVQDLATRRKIAEKYDNAYFISIHMNSFPQSKYSGLQVYHSPNTAQSMELALQIQANVTHYLQPLNNRTVKAANSSIYLLEHLSCPAVLIECGFLSNLEEAALLADEAYQQQLAWLIAISIMENLSTYNT